MFGPSFFSAELYLLVKQELFQSLIWWNFMATTLLEHWRSSACLRRKVGIVSRNCAGLSFEKVLRADK
jgi:hypothetical protein